MGSRKLDLRSAPLDYERTVEQLYGAAFGPSPSLYRRISICGWRPLNNHRKNPGDPRSSCHQDSSDSCERSIGIEVYETPDGMTIEVALSAIREESLHLAIAGEKVIIRGERKKTGKNGEHPPFAHRPNPQFQYFIPLPATISTGGFRAQLKGDIVRIDFARRAL